MSTDQLQKVKEREKKMVKIGGFLFIRIGFIARCKAGHQGYRPPLRGSLQGPQQPSRGVQHGGDEKVVKKVGTGSPRWAWS